MPKETNYVWLAEEFHGYNYIFSSWEKGFAWLEAEKSNHGAEDDEYEIDVEYGVHASIYYESDLVGSIERHILDEHI